MVVVVVVVVEVGLLAVGCSPQLLAEGAAHVGEVGVGVGFGGKGLLATAAR